MSESSQGPGWWLASDGKWYRPDQHPEYRPSPPVATQPTAPGWPPAGGRGSLGDMLLDVRSHDAGRNATVMLYADRIERVQDRKRLAISSAKQDSEVIPLRSVSSVQAKKDGLAFTKVIIFATGNTIEFRLRHEDAQRFKAAVTAQILGPH